MVGRTLSHYQILEKLGEGGMGVVYKARDPRLGRFVALKTLRPGTTTDPARKKRFLREARAASALNHPHIVTVYDIATEGDIDFIVMEYVEGKPLSELIGRRGLSARDAVEYAKQITDAVAAAHAAGIVHRDLKPGNVVVTTRGLVKVLDFGLAKLNPLGDAETPASQSLSITEGGTVVGTVSYMAPEQAKGKTVDHRADIFAFGVVLYQMLAGELPFQGGNALAILHEIQYGEPAPLRQSRPHLPASLEQVVRRALEKDPQNRFQSMEELTAELRRVEEDLDSEFGEAPTASFSAPAAARDSTPSGPPRTSSAAVTHPLSRPPTPGTERTSIAVLPFQSLSSDKEDSYMAAGLASEIISALSGVPGVRVASHLASFRFQEPAADLERVAQTLNIRYVLTGSLQRAGNRIRVIAQLTDALEGTMLWSHTYERGVEDLFAVQEDIANAIVGATGGQLIRAGAERASHAPPESLDAWGLVRKAYHFWNYAFRLEGVSEAMDLLRRAVQIDPSYAVGHAYLAFYLTQLAVNFLSEDAAQDRAEALAAAERSTQLAPGDPEVLENCGLVWFNCGKYDKAVPALRRAVEIAPFNLVAWGYLALTLAWSGDMPEVEEGRKILDRLITGTPDHPSLPYWLYFKAGACTRQDRFAEAAECAGRCVELQPLYVIGRISYANALGHLGRLEEAREAMKVVQQINPRITQELYKDSLLTIARTRERGEKQIGGLIAAGIFQP